MTPITLADAISDLRGGRRWWPAEIVLRGLGLLLLDGCWRLVLVAHRMAITPSLHQASASDLAVSAGVVLLLCSGLTLTFVGPGLFRNVPLPPHFTRRVDQVPNGPEGNLPLDRPARESARPAP